MQRPIPHTVRIRLAHACVQTIAEQAGVALLHIKGAAVEPSIRRSARGGSDVDVLVNPDHIGALDRELRRHGWEVYSTFVHGSPFGHAQTYLHPEWGYLDVHRFFPGIYLEPFRAFARLWADRRSFEIGGLQCAVPNEPAQALLLMLNSARHRGGQGVASIDAHAWSSHEAAIRSLVTELDAGVAFAASTGTLEQWRGDRRYLLWASMGEGGGRSAEWWARVRAAPTPRAALRIVARAPLVNVDRLAHRLGRRPTPAEVVTEFFRRPARALGEFGRMLRVRKAPASASPDGRGPAGGGRRHECGG